MDQAKSDLAESVSNEIEVQLDKSVRVLRKHLKKTGTVKTTFRAYVVFRTDGSHALMSVDEMSSFVLDLENEKLVFITLHFWIIEDKFDNFFECCEMLDNKGAEKFWVTKINIDDDETGIWLDENEMSVSFRSYFHDRAQHLKRAASDISST